MKIAGIDFPSPLLSALRDGELVIFAGAGVSMGEPACLPSFKELAKKIAQGTGEVLREKESEREPEDRFLGKLHQNGVKVHERAVQELSRNNPKPTDLHRDLLRLYQKNGDQVRVVTTNFDLLFEEAAQDVFGAVPEIFRAPALPLGRDFNGIVHVHGALSHRQGMILTDEDFGRAYLTEGWARRFLVELFRHFPVLFVGYRHNDIILNYLARALPPSETEPRFALTDDSDDSNLQRWELLGIEPVIYPKQNYSRLYEGVRRLAEYVNRGVLDWQREITALAEKPPPSLDEEAAGLIADSLSDAVRTRFFTQAATSPEWIDWLNKREYLVPLFGPDDLSKPSQVLATWLAEKFARDHANKLFLLIFQYQMQLNPSFWHELQKTIGKEGDKPLDRDTLARWVSLLLKTDPLNVNWYSRITLPSVWWLEISKRCNDQKLISATLQIFAAMSKSRLLLKQGFTWPSDDGNDQPPRANLPLVCDHHILNEIWEKGLKPNLNQAAKPLLSLIVRRIESQHRTLCAWNQGAQKWDHVSNYRWAIEPHDQNLNDSAIDVLINAARDSLEWLASNQADSVALWCALLIDSDVPLLRRLAIHTLPVRSDLTADDKIDWLLTHIGLHDPAAHHETERVVYQTYPKASPAQRENLIEAVVSYRRPGEDASERHFEWLSWLHRLDSTCPLAHNELDEIAARYPQFRRQEAPIDAQSSWSVEELLARPADEVLEELLAPPSTIDRHELQEAVADATKQKPDWGLDLAEALASKENWETKLWPTLIFAWRETEFDKNQGRIVLNLLKNASLHQKYGREVAFMLYDLVKDGGIPCASELLPKANKIAVALWADLDPDHPYEEGSDWLISAINHPAGTLAQFWLESLFLWRKHQDPAPDQLDGEYLAALSKIVKDRTIAGRLGKSVLAGYFASLLEIDENWTKENLLPLFFEKNHSDADDYKAIWDGFLTWRRLTPSVAELLYEAFLDAVQHINSDLSGQNRRDRFITCYTVMLVYFAFGSIEKWISEFFTHSDAEARHTFANGIGHRLHRMNETQQQEQWNRWLKRYWQDRLDGVPKPLESDEIKRMMDWLPHLKGVFPEAVDLAIQMPQSESSGKRASEVIFELERSDLPEMHPEAMAKLVLYMRPSLPPTDSAYGREEQIQRELIGKLLQSDLPPELAEQLQEIRLRLG